MKRLHHFTTALLVVLVLGCASLGLPSPQTFEQKALVTQATVTQIRASAAQLLTAKTISLSDAQNALIVTDAATSGVAVARTLYATACPPAPAASAPAAPVACTSVKADARLAVATAALTALSAYLTAQESQP